MTPLAHHLIICLYLAYALAEFVLRPLPGTQPETPLGVAVKSAISIFALAALLVGGSQWWLLAIPLAVAYAVATGLRARRKQPSWQLLIAQHALVAAVIYLGAAYLTYSSAEPWLTSLPLRLRQAAILFAGVAALWQGGAEFVEQFTGQLTRPAPPPQSIGPEDARHGLEQPTYAAGRRIGQLERLLVLGTVVAGYMEGIGFILGAKLVFRIGDLQREQDVCRAEYVLVGTFASFAWALAVSLATRRLLLAWA